MVFSVHIVEVIAPRGVSLWGLLCVVLTTHIHAYNVVGYALSLYGHYIYVIVLSLMWTHLLWRRLTLTIYVLYPSLLVGNCFDPGQKNHA
jgi:hypothetical protein